MVTVLHRSLALRHYLPSVYEVQVGIQEAAAIYRGDYNQGHFEVWYADWYIPAPDSYVHYRARLFPPAPFTLRSIFEKTAPSGSARLPRLTSNHALELTAPRRMITLSNDYITLGELDSRSRSP